MANDSLCTGFTQNRGDKTAKPVTYTAYRIQSEKIDAYLKEHDGVIGVVDCRAKWACVRPYSRGLFLQQISYALPDGDDTGEKKKLLAQLRQIDPAIGENLYALGVMDADQSFGYAGDTPYEQAYNDALKIYPGVWREPQNADRPRYA